MAGMSIPFERRPVDVDESIRENEAPLSYVRRLAETKAREAATRFGQSRVAAIGADTIVLLAHEILGKPKSKQEAARMLAALSGETHEVITAVSLAMPDGSVEVFHDVTRVRFRTLNVAEIDTYIETGSPMDKAGGYGIQDDAGEFVDDIEGSFSNVVGLPVERFVDVCVEANLLEGGLAARLATIRGRMAAAAPNHQVQTKLIGASKAQSVDVVRQAQALGLTEFGESYVQEWSEKVETLETQPNWHFMGRLQSNKLKRIVSSAKLIHTVASQKHLATINRHAAAMGKQMSCLLQVNVGGEDSKAGVEPSALRSLVDCLSDYPNVACRGLMTLPPMGTFAETRRYFGQLRDLAREHFPELPDVELSMGMSSDLESAVSQGSTMVRVGTALFGPRQ